MNNWLIILITFIVLFGLNFYIMKGYNREWYDKLNKPSWTPSGQFIGTMWTIIYITVIISWYLALRNTEGAGARTLISILFLINLALNVSWSYFFFNQQNTIVPLGIVGGLIFTLLLLIFVIYRYSKVASLLLFIYLIWVSIAGYLNSYIVNNN
jgi:translocator protein